MLIAAYAGCGKSRAAQELGLLDLPSMPYRWLLPYQDPDTHGQAEFEREKGALHHIGDPRFPQNYVLEILRAEQKGKTVLFPTIIPVIDILVERYGRTVHVVCPEDGLKEEYRQRYLKRGNSDSFLSIFIGGWEDRMEAIGKSRGIHHRLKSGKYLTPLAAKLLEQDRPAPVSDIVLAELAQEVEKLGREQILLLWSAEGNRPALPINDIDRPETREFLERVGKATYDSGMPWVELYSKQFVQNLGDSWRSGIIWLDGEEQFLDAVARAAKEWP